MTDVSKNKRALDIKTALQKYKEIEHGETVQSIFFSIRLKEYFKFMYTVTGDKRIIKTTLEVAPYANVLRYSLEDQIKNTDENESFFLRREKPDDETTVFDMFQAVAIMMRDPKTQDLGVKLFENAILYPLIEFKKITQKERKN